MYDYFSIRDNQVTITVKVCQLYKSVITEATTRGYLLHRFLHTPQSAHEDLRLSTSQDLCYSNTLHFTNGSIKALSERQKKRRNRHQKKHYEFEAARPQFATLIWHTCDGAAFHFCVKIRNVCGDNDYSAKSSAEMRRQNEQIIPLKFFSASLRQMQHARLNPFWEAKQEERLSERPRGARYAPAVNVNGLSA